LSDSIVIIPTYNEKENIEKIIRAVFLLEQPFDILIVDDGSPDGTADIVRSLMVAFPNRIYLEERKGKLGLGTAYIHGFRWALAHDYEYIFEMDADFSHSPDDLPRLYAACKQGEIGMSIGSRYIRGGKLVNWPFLRVALSYGASLYVRLITLMPVADSTAGFVCYNRAVLDSIDLDKIRFVGYAFQIEMKYAAWQLGFRLKEIPITFIDRTEGVSKMSRKIIWEAVFGVLRMRWFTFFSSYHKRK
jgi:dolichol-phosphate mannosyltransferase